MRGSDALSAAMSEMTRDLLRQTKCGAEHPKSGARCVLRALDGHTKHKTELSERWTT